MMRKNRNFDEEGQAEPDVPRKKRIDQRKKTQSATKSGLPLFAFIGLFFVACILYLVFRKGGSRVGRGIQPPILQSVDAFSGQHWVTPQTIERKLMYSTPRTACEVHTISDEKGRTVQNWLWVDSQNQVNVIVQLAETGKFLLFKQHRYAIKGLSLAPVDGEIMEKEEPQQAVKRILKDKLQLEAEALIPLGHHRVDADHGGGFVESFLALNARSAPGATPAQKRPETVLLSKSELQQAISEMKIPEIQWVTSILLALNWLRAQIPV